MTWSGWLRCAALSGRMSRCASTPTAHGRSPRPWIGLRGLAELGIELCEEPVHGVEALRAVRQRLDGRVPIAMDETAAEAGRAGVGCRRRRVPEGRALRRDQRALEAARAARARRRRRLPGLHLRRPGRASPPRCTWRRRWAWTAPAAWPRWAVRGLCGPVPGARRRDRSANRAGAGGGVSDLSGPERRARPQRSVARSASTRRTAARLAAAERRPATASRTRAS